MHSVINKMTGGLLFIFPLTLVYIDLEYSAAAICTYEAEGNDPELILCKKR